MTVWIVEEWYDYEDSNTYVFSTEDKAKECERVLRAQDEQRVRSVYNSYIVYDVVVDEWPNVPKTSPQAD